MSRRFLHNVSLRRAPYDQTREYDVYLDEFVKQVREKITKVDDDDYLLVIAGPPRSGKSNLGLHIYASFDPDNMCIDFVAQNRNMFADSLKLAKSKDGLRYLQYDEANVNKRDSLSGWNKDMMDLYFAIGGLNIFHVWCNPSIDMLDKAFIEERVKGLILVYDKSEGRRVYFFFKVKALLTIFERFGNLKLRTLIKNRHLAYYQGWFREYVGVLKRPYLSQKQLSMSAKVDSFAEKWGSDSQLTREVVAKRIGVSVTTVKRYERELLGKGLLIEGDNVWRNNSGKIFYKESVMLFFMDLAGQSIAGVVE